MAEEAHEHPEPRFYTREFKLEAVQLSETSEKTVAQSARDLEPGDIMVAAATDPGWTAIFPLASGLVIEAGGQLSHGAIVAREYGIPAVVNVPGAMQTIREGQLLEVDGTTGRAALLANAGAAF